MTKFEIVEEIVQAINKKYPMKTEGKPDKVVTWYPWHREVRDQLYPYTFSYYPKDLDKTRKYMNHKNKSDLVTILGTLRGW